jgi:hypothetical protein
LGKKAQILERLSRGPVIIRENIWEEKKDGKS